MTFEVIRILDPHQSLGRCGVVMNEHGAVRVASGEKVVAVLNHSRIQWISQDTMCVQGVAQDNGKLERLWLRI